MLKIFVGPVMGGGFEPPPTPPPVNTPLLLEANATENCSELPKAIEIIYVWLTRWITIENDMREERWDINKHARLGD
jgi:hypothetical protein